MFPMDKEGYYKSVQYFESHEQPLTTQFVL